MILIFYYEFLLFFPAVASLLFRQKQFRGPPNQFRLTILSAFLTSPLIALGLVYYWKRVDIYDYI